VRDLHKKENPAFAGLGSVKKSEVFLD